MTADTTALCDSCGGPGGCHPASVASGAFTVPVQICAGCRRAMITGAPVPGPATVPAPAPRPAADELLAGYLHDMARRGLMATTVTTRRRRVQALIAALDPTSILDATTEDLQGYLDSCRLSSNTRRDYIMHARTFYRWATSEDLVDVDPTAAIVPPRKKPGRPKPMTDVDIARAVAAARQIGSRRLEAMIALGALAGLRAQEIAGMHAEDVDFAEGAIHVRQGKGGKQRTVPLHPQLAEALRRLPLPATGIVFRLLDGTPVQPYRVSQLVGRHLHRIGVAGTCHALRHTFATNLYRSTQDLRLTQELLGHSSPAITAVYAAADPTRAAPAVAGLRLGPDLG